jgi:hypothetical protein
MYVKELLAKDFVKNLEKELIEAVKKSPEEWDGVELRWLLKDKTAEHVWYGMIDKRNKRYKDYKNFVLVNNL